MDHDGDSLAPVELDSTRQSSFDRDGISLRPLVSAHGRRGYKQASSNAVSTETLGREPTPNETEDANPFDHQKFERVDLRQRPRFFLNWWQEVAALFLAFAATLSLFGTLYSYAGKPSPNWPQWISLNTAVAIYIVVIKTGILLVTAEGLGQLKWLWFATPHPRPLADLVRYDDATRGPLGAMGLLWTLRLSHILSSTAALIVVLALAMDPFAQQILHYYDCSILEHDRPASVSRTNYFAEVGGIHTGALQTNIVPEAQSAVNAGIFSPNRSPGANCPTGNCTWANQYTSIGFCSMCSDLTDQLDITNNTFEYTNQFDNTTATTWNLTTALPDGGLAVNMTFAVPETQYAVMGPSFNDTTVESDFRASIDFVLAKDIAGTINPSTGEPFPECNTAAANETLWKCKGYGASRCQLFPCIKTYNASVEAGILSETLLETASQIWGDGEAVLALAAVDLHCINGDERKSLQNLGYQINDTERWLAYNLSFPLSTVPPLNNTFPESMAFRSCIYAVDVTFLNSFSQYLENLFNGVINGPTIVGEAELGLFTGPQVIQSIFNFGDIYFARMNESFANISTSITNYIRSNGIANFSTAALGSSSQYKTCIAVRWGWLAYPAVLVLMTIIFFVLMVLETWPTGDRPEIWKSSPLALLYHGLSHKSEEEQVPPMSVVNSTGAARDLGGMKKLARQTTVKLGETVDNVAHFEIQNVPHLKT